MSNDGSFKEQIRKIAIKTREMSGWVLRTFKSREKGILLALWKSLVIPHFDYCSQLWSPTNYIRYEEEGKDIQLFMYGVSWKILFQTLTIEKMVNSLVAL